jgi:hypothetical protein
MRDEDRGLTRIRIARGRTANLEQRLGLLWPVVGIA